LLIRGVETFGIGTTMKSIMCRTHKLLRYAYEKWGVLFFPLYCGSSLIQLLCGRNPYSGNHFERQAGEMVEGSTW